MQDRPLGKTLFVILALMGFVLILVPQVSALENSCIDCHKTLSPFIEIQKQFNQIRIQHVETGISCSLECHEDRVRQLATANYHQWSESVHALKEVTCEVCHEGDKTQVSKEKAHEGIKKTTDPESPVYYTNVPETCGKCHPNELNNFEQSKHYQKLEALKLAPSCTTCHPPHTFTILNTVEFRNFCGNCHSVYKKVAPFDIPVKAEYLLTKVNRLKFNIDNTQKDIFWAEKNGTDVTELKQYVEKALELQGGLAPMWHEFNLTHFEGNVDLANKEIEKAQEILNPEPTPKKTEAPSTPGFMGISVIISMLAISYVLRKK